MDLYIYPLVIAAGFGCGFINTLAGSGSLISLPVLIFLGLPANVANGTNRIGILLQAVVSARSYQKGRVLDMRGAATLAVPAMMGSVIGAQIAVNLDEQLMRRVIGGLIIILLALIIFKPGRWLKGQKEVMEQRPGPKILGVFFLIGFYGGFIHAGVGIFLLSGLVLGVGYNLVRANAVKVTIVFCFTAVAIGVFFLNDQIDWKLGILLAIGNAIGGWTAAKLALKRGTAFVRLVLIGVASVSAIKLLGLFDLAVKLF
ncbi:MAG: sulfite exporter TauE/SafE family protein [Deltaproteobacteria bacterium]|nr:sulfite exporter TauE/SafE family protein [Deltaproteobacteria bacterium]MBW2139059.1 sulfite exporter TauE/SafE family protein [Deltaproteobacteria bacterium]